jgi:uncharacterized protein YlxW (UPF0749 family)
MLLLLKKFILRRFLKMRRPFKLTTPQIAIAIVCLIVGITFSIQIKSVSKNALLDPFNRQRLDNMAVAYADEKDRSQSYYTQMMEYKEQLEYYQELEASNSDTSAALKNQLEKAELAAGMSEVQGPGVIFTLNDSLTSTLDTSNASLIHDSDLLTIINELKNAGAEAISINGERLIATSDIRCAGTVIQVNKHSYAPPYVISAIGDPQTLETALKMPGGIVANLEIWGIQMDVQKKDNIVIPRYAGAVTQTHAKPISASDEKKGREEAAQ